MPYRLPYLLHALFLLGWATLPTETAAQDFSQLLGAWQRTRTDGAVVFEVWTAHSDTLLAGKSHIIRPDGTTSTLETLRLTRFGSHWVYLAAPRNQAPAAFWFDSQASTQAYFVFRNTEHDYPKRIVYDLRQPDLLTAWIDDGNDETNDSRYFQFTRKG